MALDNQQGYTDIKKKTTLSQKYRKVKKDIKDLEKKTGNNFETWAGGVETKYGKYGAQKLKSAENYLNYQKKNLKTQFDELLDIKFLSAESGDTKSMKYLKKTFSAALIELKPKIEKILAELMVKTLGCDQDSSFPANTSVYIKVKSIDLLNLLKEEPDSLVGQVCYESNPIIYQNQPFSMNKELRNRIQNINIPYSAPSFGNSNYIGSSGQDLFDITYVDNYINPLGQTVVGDFFKIDFFPRSSNTNKISEFLEDYFKTIDIIDYKHLYANLIQNLTGSLSIEKGDGDTVNGDFTKIMIIMKRIFGLCFDETQEIDVSGISKLSQSDNIDDSFFEFDEMDLKYIDLINSNIKIKVVEFEDCQNVKLTVDSNSLLTAVNNLTYFPGQNNNNQLNDASEELTETMKNSFFPFEINFDETFLKEYPRALVMTILSPKTLLPLIALGKSLGQDLYDDVQSFVDFAKKFKTFFVAFVSKVGAEFVRIIFNLIKKDILSLSQVILTDINDEIRKKKEVLVLALIAIAVKLVSDFRSCKSVIDELLSILNLVQKNLEKKKKPLPYALVKSSQVLQGFSKTRAVINVIEQFDKLGLPTDPMPDGSPNLMLAAVDAIIGGIDKEETQNGQVQVAIDPLSLTPIGTTIPQVMFGKKL